MIMSQSKDRENPLDISTELLKNVLRFAGGKSVLHTYTLGMEPGASEGASWMRESVFGQSSDPSVMMSDVLNIYKSSMLRQIEIGYLEITSQFSEAIGTVNATLKEVRSNTDILVGLSGSRAENIFIQNLRNPSYRLIQSIPITLVYEQDEVIARYDDVGLYGSGELRQDALNELCESIIDYYETLSEEKNKLGPLPQSHWEFLKEIIQEA